MRCVMYLGMSVDGFISRPDGGIDWLETVDVGDDDLGFTDFMASIDSLIMGRVTFEQFLGFGVPWPYGDVQVVILSTTRGPDLIPPELADRAVVRAGEPADILAELEALGCTSAYIDGGDAVRRFLAAGVVTELALARLPILIGEGISPFGKLPADLELTHTKTEVRAGGIVKSWYRVGR